MVTTTPRQVRVRPHFPLPPGSVTLKEPSESRGGASFPHASPSRPPQVAYGEKGPGTAPPRQSSGAAASSTRGRSARTPCASGPGRLVGSRAAPGQVLTLADSSRLGWGGVTVLPWLTGLRSEVVTSEPRTESCLRVWQHGFSWEVLFQSRPQFSHR